LAHIRPKPDAFSIAKESFYLSFSLLEYSGKKKWLKQVEAEGNLSVSPPCLINVEKKRY